jgi:predicted RNA methylase
VKWEYLPQKNCFQKLAENVSVQLWISLWAISVSYEALLSVDAVKLSSMSFKFVDLFAGIGGFHGALSALGGTCVYASEIDRAAARVYVRNWGIEPDGDITLAANEFNMDVPEHDVLVGGFP